MKALRHRLRLRIALLAVLALLWSQTALAWHAVCEAELPLTAAQVLPMAGHDGDACPDVPPPAGDGTGLCAAHCVQGTPSPDVGFSRDTCKNAPQNSNNRSWAIS